MNFSIVMSQRVCCYYNIVKCYFATFKNCPIMWENRHMQILCKISISLFPFAKQKGTYKFFSHHHHAPSVLRSISYAKMTSFGYESKIYCYVALKNNMNIENLTEQVHTRKPVNIDQYKMA